MKLKLIYLFLLIWVVTATPGKGQLIADFKLDNTTNMPASLLENAVGQDALSINPNARSDGQGVFMLPDPNNPGGEIPNIELEIGEDLLNHTESIYLEFDFRSQEDFAWFINSGFDLFRFAHAIGDPDNQGFNVRYATKKDTADLIESGYVGEPLAEGERALIAFMYDAQTGTAYIFKNGTEVWQTPPHRTTPGYGMHWETDNGSFTIGASMNGEGSATPSLYRFRAFENACTDIFPPTAEPQTVCGPYPVSLKASGGTDGQYRWYKQEGENLILINGERDSVLDISMLSQTTTYYVALASDLCQSAPVAVEAVVQPIPEQPQVNFTPACGPGEKILYLENQQPNTSYWWTSEDGIIEIQQNDSLSLNITQDTVIYVKAGNGFCESTPLPISIQLYEPPSINAGADVVILRGESVDLYASGNFTSCKWSGAPDIEDRISADVTVSPEKSATYVVTAINESGCESSDTINVFVQNKFPVPNAFSPNNDGRNDRWEIPNIHKYPQCRVAIFNQWGNEVFSSKGYQNPWDGTLNGSPLPFGSYFYSLQLSPGQKPIKGSVVILR